MLTVDFGADSFDVPLDDLTARTLSNEISTTASSRSFSLASVVFLSCFFSAFLDLLAELLSLLTTISFLLRDSLADDEASGRGTSHGFGSGDVGEMESEASDSERMVAERLNAAPWSEDFRVLSESADVAAACLLEAFLMKYQHWDLMCEKKSYLRWTRSIDHAASVALYHLAVRPTSFALVARQCSIVFVKPTLL